MNDILEKYMNHHVDIYKISSMCCSMSGNIGCNVEYFNDKKNKLSDSNNITVNVYQHKLKELVITKNNTFALIKIPIDTVIYKNYVIVVYDKIKIEPNAFPYLTTFDCKKEIIMINRDNFVINFETQHKNTDNEKIYKINVSFYNNKKYDYENFILNVFK